MSSMVALYISSSQGVDPSPTETQETTALMNIFMFSRVKYASYEEK